MLGVFFLLSHLHPSITFCSCSSTVRLVLLFPSAALLSLSLPPSRATLSRSTTSSASLLYVLRICPLLFLLTLVFVQGSRLDVPHAQMSVVPPADHNAHTVDTDLYLSSNPPNARSNFRVGDWMYERLFLFFFFAIHCPGPGPRRGSCVIHHNCSEFPIPMFWTPKCFNWYILPPQM